MRGTHRSLARSLAKPRASSKTSDAGTVPISPCRYARSRPPIGWHLASAPRVVEGHGEGGAPGCRTGEESRHLGRADRATRAAVSGGVAAMNRPFGVGLGNLRR